MNILESHIHTLRFWIDCDMNKKYMDKWIDLKYTCETGKNQLIVNVIKSNCSILSNKNLPYLNNMEGGMGKNKQIRFRDYKLWSQIPKYTDNFILFDNIINTNDEKWTYEELDDLINAFIKTANTIVGIDCVNGCIQIVNKNNNNTWFKL